MHLLAYSGGQRYLSTALDGYWDQRTYPHGSRTAATETADHPAISFQSSISYWYNAQPPPFYQLRRIAIGRRDTAAGLL